MGYTTDTIKGVSWMSGFRIVTRMFAFARIAFLARLLTPVQFGIFGVASLALTFFETFSHTGTNVFIVQERKKMEKYVDSAYVISIVRGILIAFFIFVSAPALAKYFGSPDSTPLLRLIAIVALVRGFINPSRVRFIKDLRFNYEFYFSLAVFVVDAGVSVLTAYTLRSPVSLVYGLIAGALVEMTISHLVIKPRPKFRMNMQEIKLMLTRGKWVTGANIFNYFFEHGDDLTVGKLLNTTALGIYQASYKIAMLPLSEIVKVISQVTFPIYTNIAGEKLRLKRAFARTSLGVLFLILPIGFILHKFSYEVVIVILGENWASAAPVVEALALFGIARALVVSVTPLFNSVKRQDIVAKISFIGVVCMFLFLIPFVNNFGLIGATYAVFAGSVATLPFIYYYLNKVLN